MASVSLCGELEQSAYRVLFAIENALRLLIRWELRGRLGKSWAGAIAPDVLRESKRRQEQEKEIGVLDAYRSGLLSYLQLSELKDLIVGPLWADCFGRCWPAQDVVRTELRKLIAVRNKVAHFRPVTRRDARVVMRFAEDLADWTAVYRRLTSSLAEAAGEGDPRVASTGMKVVARRLRELSPVQGSVIRLHTIGHHAVLAAELGAGALVPARLLELLDRHEKIVTFCRLREFGAGAWLYVPSCVPPQEVIALLDGLWAACNQPGENLSSAAAEEEFEVAKRENVVTWGTDVPNVFFYE